MNYIEFHEEKCIACDLCSGVCSLSKLGRVQPRAPASTIDAGPGRVPSARMRCSVCDMTHDRGLRRRPVPQEALVWDEAAGVVRFVQELCTDCGSCLEACPNVHRRRRRRERIMICDLCDGDPLCVKWCPEGALTWEVRHEVRRATRASSSPSTSTPAPFGELPLDDELAEQYLGGRGFVAKLLYDTAAARHRPARTRERDRLRHGAGHRHDDPHGEPHRGRASRAR